jgi:hypothetical protein
VKKFTESGPPYNLAFETVSLYLDLGCIRVITGHITFPLTSLCV